MTATSHLPPLFLAQIDTRNSEFSALGRTKEEAEGAVVRAYEAWAAACPDRVGRTYLHADGTVSSPLDDIQITEYRVGVPLMDRQDMSWCLKEGEA